MKRFFHLQNSLILVLLCCLFSTSCRDELLYEPDGDRGDGYVELEFLFAPQGSVNLNTRSPGTAINEIQNIYVGVFQDAPAENPEQMTLIQGYYFDSKQLDVSYLRPSTDQQDAIYRAVPKNRVKIPGGYHRILVAANVGDLSGKVDNVKEFMEYQLPEWQDWEDWSEDNDNNTRNNAMSGYFYDQDEPKPASDPTSILSKSRIQISSKTQTLHAWLRRAASKVTVDFDGSGLLENVFVYIKDITIHDIPTGCQMMALNTPSSASQLKADGESISVDTLKSGQTIDKYYHLLPSITKEGNKYHDFFPNPHANDSKASLFFYENAQGLGEDKRQDADKNGSIDHPYGGDNGVEWHKDKKPYGTWIEVTGYYVSNNEKGRGRGEIKYRFMLGQDVTTNYNAFRNTHYKLTLALKGLGNDVDWHIEYEDVTQPGILTDVYYVSYLYNQPQIVAGNDQTMNDYWEKLYPVRIIAKKGQNIGSTMKVRIIENNWGPDQETGDPSGFEFYTGNVYTSNATSVPSCNSRAIAYDGIWNGFLSLYHYSGQPTSIAKGHRYSASVYIDWYSRGSNPYFASGNITTTVDDDDETVVTAVNKNPLARTQEFNYGEGYREFNTAVGEYKDDINGSYRVTEEMYNGEYARVVWIPLFTRPLIISQTKSFTGNNPYYSFQRRAKIKISVDYDGDGVDNDSEATVYQVRRIINPKGVFRSADNDDSFTVSLMHRTGETRAHHFTTFHSEGPWRASLVVNPGNGWTIEGINSGGTGSPVSVTVKPSSKISDPEHRCALLKFEYHDYKCVHYVVLRQGYAPIRIDDGNGSIPQGPYWHTFNLKSLEGETENPLEEGSMFRYGNLSQPIDAINNRIYETMLQIVGQTDDNGFWMSPIKKTENMAEGNTRTLWDSIKSNAKNDPGDFSKKNIVQSGWRLPTNDDFGALFKNNDIEFGFGICYADGASGCSDEDNEAHRYSWFAKSPLDWEKLLGFDKEDSNYIDESDQKGEYGMRATFVYNKNNARCIMFPMGHTGYGVRRHSSENSHRYGNTGIAGGMGQLRYGGVTEPFPAKWNNYYVPLLYTLYTQYGAIYWMSDVKTWPNKEEARAWDFNYSTMDFGPYPSNEIFDANGKNSHAFFIKLVQNQAPTSAKGVPKRKKTAKR